MKRFYMEMNGKNMAQNGIFWKSPDITKNLRVGSKKNRDSRVTVNTHGGVCGGSKINHC